MTSQDGLPRIDLSDIYRASVEPMDWRGNVRMVFIEASSERDASLKVAGIVAILEHRSLAEAVSWVYNVKSPRQCIDDGSSVDPELRMFEIGRSGLAFVRQPIFLLKKPAALTRKWLQIQSPDQPTGVWS
jgi:hypothetical protein